MQGLKLALTFCCMMFALYVLLSVSELNFYSPRVIDCPNQDTKNFIYWIRCEMMSSVSVSFACTAFMFLRYCSRTKLQIITSLERHMTTPQIDTLVALMPLCHAFVNDVGPFLVIAFQVYTNGWSCNHDRCLPAPTDLYFMFSTQTISLVIVVLFIFVSWREGPAWWTKIAPYLYYAGLQLWGIVFPLANVIAFIVTCLVHGGEWNHSTYTNWGVCYCILMVARLITYAFFYRRTWVKREYDNWEAHKQFLMDKESGKIDEDEDAFMMRDPLQNRKSTLIRQNTAFQKLRAKYNEE